MAGDRGVRTVAEAVESDIDGASWMTQPSGGGCATK